jgi:phospholipase/carboxylesterase
VDAGRDEQRTIGGLAVKTRGDVDTPGLPVVVLAHGFASRANDLAPLFDAFGPALRFVFPEAPIALGDDAAGRAWWHIDVAARDAAMARGEERDLSRQIPSGLASARATFDRLLDEVVATMSPSALFVGGFSQGAILACDATLRSSRAIAGLVVLSGARIAADQWRPLYSTRRGLPVFQSHGRADAHLSFVVAESLQRELVDAGLDVTWVPFDGAHEVPLVALRALRKFLKLGITRAGG